jgi:hypothetical protein
MAKTSGRAVIQQICEHHRGDPPEVLVPAIMNALKGHNLVIVPDPAAAVIEYCRGGCRRSQLRAGRCDVCGWTSNPEED